MGDHRLKAYGSLYRRLAKAGNLRAGPLDMEPLEVLREFIEDPACDSISGPPQVGRVAPGDRSPEALTRTGQGDFHHPAPPLVWLVAMSPISAPTRADGEAGSVPAID